MQDVPPGFVLKIPRSVPNAPNTRPANSGNLHYTQLVEQTVPSNDLHLSEERALWSASQFEEVPCRNGQVACICKSSLCRVNCCNSLVCACDSTRCAGVRLPVLKFRILNVLFMLVHNCTQAIYSNEVRYCLYVQSACPMTVQSLHVVTDSRCDTDATLVKLMIGKTITIN